MYQCFCTARLHGLIVKELHSVCCALARGVSANSAGASFCLNAGFIRLCAKICSSKRVYALLRKKRGLQCWTDCIWERGKKETALLLLLLSYDGFFHEYMLGKLLSGLFNYSSSCLRMLCVKMSCCCFLGFSKLHQLPKLLAITVCNMEHSEEKSFFYVLVFSKPYNHEFSISSSWNSYLRGS